MSDRGQLGVDGPPACPFVAFEDERDERSPSPDHRHRCYAEVQPAPRALAHQEAYCLSSAFPVCPTFQDWARREAAQARSSGRAAAAPPIGAAVTAAAASESGPPPEPESSPEPEPVDADPWSPPPDTELPPRRNPPRDWAAPPPWASGAAGNAGGAGAAASARGVGDPDDRPPEFLANRSASQGLAGSAADRLAAGQPVVTPSATPASPASDELAGLVAPAAVGAATSGASPPLTRPPSGAYPTTTASGRRPTVSSTRDRNQSIDHNGPSWEHAKRYEAYPTIKTRAGLPGIPRIAVWAGALGVAALALFFLPALLGFGGGAGSSPSPSPTPIATASQTPTPVPEPTAQTYTIRSGDTLNKIAKKFDVTVDQLIAANKKTIKDPDKIKVGQEIIIPVPIPDEFTDPDAAAPSADAEATPEP